MDDVARYSAQTNRRGEYLEEAKQIGREPYYQEEFYYEYWWTE